MAKHICEDCGCEFDPNEAADLFNARYADGYDYFYNGWDTFCGECAIEQMKYILKNRDNSDSIPDGCRECGGDYPNCADSCSMFDD